MKNKLQPNNENEEIIGKVQKLMEERGRKPLEMARKAILEEKIESKEVREALHYFMTEYWQDLARPTLMSICCEAVGGDPNATIPFAIPLSLISGALDIQDDIIDQSKTKHGRPTVYGKYGKEIAILTADALLFKGFTLLSEACLEIPKEKAKKIMKTIKDLFYELGDAEALELNLRGKLNITPKEYLCIIERKAADVEAHTFISALFGDESKNGIEILSDYGRKLGILIILRDEYADTMYPEELIYRIKKEHLPLPIVYALQNLAIKPKLIKILKKRNITQKDAQEIVKILSEENIFEKMKEMMINMKESVTEKLHKMKGNISNLELFLRFFV